MTILIAAVVLLAAYATYIYLRIKRVARMVRNYPEQTGEFWLGSKSSPKLSVLMLGDSVASGFGISKFEDSVGGRIAKALSKKYRVHFVNRAAKGNRLSRIAAKRVSGQWDLVILITGSNEALNLVSLAGFRRDLANFIGQFEGQKTKVIIVGPGRVTSARVLPPWWRAFLMPSQWRIGQIMRQTAEQQKAIYCKASEHRLRDGDFANDGLHPSAKGHKLWFNVIWRGVEEALQW